MPHDEVDAVWRIIAEATEAGNLGSESKVSTAMTGFDGSPPTKHVICVYTYDWMDVEDVRRIRAELRSLGIVTRIPYKTDEDTLAGKYAETGHKRISKYYE